MTDVQRRLQEMLAENVGDSDGRLLGTGRGPSGKLRNFRAMNDTKFADVRADVLAEGDDPEAIEAVEAEFASRQ